jgi:hypothetical protein
MTWTCHPYSAACRWTPWMNLPLFASDERLKRF